MGPSCTVKPPQSGVHAEWILKINKLAIDIQNIIPKLATKMAELRYKAKITKKLGQWTDRFLNNLLLAKYHPTHSTEATFVKHTTFVCF